MKDILLEVIILLLLICIITLIIIQIRKTYNINTVLNDANNILENFSIDDKKPEKCSETCQHPYINLTSRLNTLENTVDNEKIQTAQNTKIIKNIQAHIDNLKKAMR